MALKDEMKAWLKAKTKSYTTGVKLLAQFESKYKDYFEQHKNAKPGDVAFILLENRIKRAVRILEAQKAHKPVSAAEEVKEQEKPTEGPTQKKK